MPYELLGARFTDFVSQLKTVAMTATCHTSMKQAEVAD